jgi:hypothetical protein
MNPPEVMVRNGDLLVFIDDTGHETFGGDQPYYGLGGCIVQAEAYTHYLTNLWKTVRQQILGHPEAPLHASDLPRHDENFKILRSFFADPSFLRIAATTTQAITVLDEVRAADAVMGKIQEEIQFVASVIPCERVVLMVESSQRADPMVRERWGGLAPVGPDLEVPMEYCLMPKSSHEPGLEIADFIINAAGSQTRRYMRGTTGAALDFADVFLQVPTIGSRFSIIRGVTMGAAGEIIGLDQLRLFGRQDVDLWSSGRPDP